MTNINAASVPAAPDKKAIVIKGSWEDVLLQAQHLAGNQNDEAIPAFQKIVQRLSMLPEAQRMANNERLQTICLQAAYQLQAYLTLRERYDEALAVLEIIKALADTDGKSGITNQQIRVLLMAERPDEAFVNLHEAALAPGADISDWGALVMQYLRYHRLEEATHTLEEATAWMEAQRQEEELDDESLGEYRGYLADLRADLAIAQEAWDEAETHYAEAIKHNTLYQQNIHLFYMRLLQHGQPARALSHIQRNYQYPIRTGFWRGVALQRLGQSEEANQEWRRVVAIDPTKGKEPSFSELVLTHYYLGDKERIGLSNVLQVLQESRRYDWQTLFLAGLGWAIQGRLENVEANFQTAVNQRRMTGQGKRLPKQVWDYCVDLLDSETQDKVAKYFDTEN